VAPLAGVVGFAAVGVCSLAVVDVFGVGGDGGGYDGGGAESSRRVAAWFFGFAENGSAVFSRGMREAKNWCLGRRGRG